MKTRMICILVLSGFLFSCDPQEDRMVIKNNSTDTILFEIRKPNRTVILPSREVQPMSQEKVIKLSSWESVYDNLKPDSLIYVYISKKNNQDSIFYCKGYNYNQLNSIGWIISFPDDNFKTDK